MLESLRAHPLLTDTGHIAKLPFLPNDMSSYASSDSRRVSPACGVKFDTAHRKKASPNIFENINQDVLVKLFEKAGDLKAVERARSILTLHQDPEGISKALMALQQDKKDKYMLITGLTRQSLKFRWEKFSSGNCAYVCTDIKKKDREDSAHMLEAGVLQDFVLNLRWCPPTRVMLVCCENKELVQWLTWSLSLKTSEWHVDASWRTMQNIWSMDWCHGRNLIMKRFSISNVYCNVKKKMFFNKIVLIISWVCLFLFSLPLYESTLSGKCVNMPIYYIAKTSI